MGSHISKPASLQVLKLKKDTISHRMGLLPFLHFITRVNNKSILSRADIKEMLTIWSEQDLTLNITDSRTKTSFTITIPKQVNNESLGISAGFHETSPFLLAMEITNIKENSTAMKAGLINNQDFILGVENEYILDDGIFMNFLFKNIGKSVVLIVYNAGMQTLRRVEIVPEWDNLLGAELVIGYLHSIPDVDIVFDFECDTTRKDLYLQCAKKAKNKEIENTERIVSKTSVDELIVENVQLNEVENKKNIDIYVSTEIHNQEDQNIPEIQTPNLLHDGNLSSYVQIEPNFIHKDLVNEKGIETQNNTQFKSLFDTTVDQQKFVNIDELINEEPVEENKILNLDELMFIDPIDPGFSMDVIEEGTNGKNPQEEQKGDSFSNLNQGLCDILENKSNLKTTENFDVLANHISEGSPKEIEGYDFFTNEEDIKLSGHKTHISLGNLNEVSKISSDLTQDLFQKNDETNLNINNHKKISKNEGEDNDNFIDNYVSIKNESNIAIQENSKDVSSAISNHTYKNAVSDFTFTYDNENTVCNTQDNNSQEEEKIVKDTGSNWFKHKQIREKPSFNFTDQYNLHKTKYTRSETVIDNKLADLLIEDTKDNFSLDDIFSDLKVDSIHFGESQLNMMESPKNHKKDLFSAEEDKFKKNSE